VDILEERRDPSHPAQSSPVGGRILSTRVLTAAFCALLGFLLVAQLRTSETIDDRLAVEREEDLAVILADLTRQSDRLQSEISDLRLLLFEFESSVEAEELARRSLEQRLDALRVLAGVAEVENEGVVLTIEDPGGLIGHERLVDVVHELRDSGAEAIAVNGSRLVASSAFMIRNERLLLDGDPLESPYRVAAVGPSDALASTLALPGGALDSLRSVPQVGAHIEQLAQLTVPARQTTVPFVFAEPVPEDDASG
jgi:uncharacterized protein YlxW (UPF0749 family)